ncbi:MAG: DUF1592 domain-containing protein [Bryobacterales bacterium]|nr:DUF1592 domain-containing protein [Bryobacterales bacterium]
MRLFVLRRASFSFRRASVRLGRGVATLAFFSSLDAATFPEAQATLKKHCAACHSGKAASGGFTLTKLAAEKSLEDEARTWGRILARVRENEMPPQNAPAMPAEARHEFVKFIDTSLFKLACADGIAPGPTPLRRLNRHEYTASIRDLLNIHVNAGHALPADGAGGEGFDNAAETLFLSPIHAEKYMEGARIALEYAFADSRSRSRFLKDAPDATKVLAAFLPRAFRRPARAGEVERYLALFNGAKARGEKFDPAMKIALQAVLMSPNFLFHLEAPNPEPTPRLLDQPAFAARLSYFLWGSVPDDKLSELATQGKLHDPVVIKEQVDRLLKDPKSTEFAERFVEQWLGTRELGRDIKPDMKLFPEYYDEEIQSGMRYEPIIFFQEVLAGNLPLTDLIDSKWTVLTNKLEKHYGLNTPGERLRQQPRKRDLPAGDHHRGGLLGMAAIHAVSSMPNRTSPVLRGKWILDAMLGAPAPPPPPNVPPLKASEAAAPTTLRERLTLHRANPVCASCHNKIDPLGFGLENYDVLGRWRTEDQGKPIDAMGELVDGTRFNGPQELKAVIMNRKDEFMRNLSTKLLGYALGRGLIREESCTLDRIGEALQRDGYKAQTLVNEIVLSIPFRYQQGTNPRASAPAQ